MITQVNTGHPLVFRFDNVFSPEECLVIENYVKEKIDIKPNINTDIEPWHENQNINYNNIDDINIKKLINSYRFLTTQFIFYAFNQPSLPTFTDIVFWQEGRYMNFHVDDGYGEVENLFTRVFSSILYINDDFEGGETVVKGSPDYISKPKKGSIVFFKSDESCLHGVNKVLKGNRITVGSWFTLYKKDIEI